jgi:hypothetical protein
VASKISWLKVAKRLEAMVEVTNVENVQNLGVEWDDMG